MRRIVAVTITTLIVLIVATFSLWLCSPYLAPAVAGFILKPYGIEVLGFDIERPGFSRQTFNRIRLGLAQGVVDLQNGKIGYSLDFDQFDLQVKQLDWLFSPEYQVKSEGNDLSGYIADYLPSRYWPVLPSLCVRIEHATIGMPEQSFRVDGITLSSNSEYLTLKAGLLSAGQQQPLLASLMLSADNSLNLQLHGLRKDTESAVVSISIDESTESQLQVHGDLTVGEQFAARLTEYLNFPAATEDLSSLNRVLLDISPSVKASFSSQFENQLLRDFVAHPVMTYDGNSAVKLVETQGGVLQINAIYDGSMDGDIWELRLKSDEEQNRLLTFDQPIKKNQHSLEASGDLHVIYNALSKQLQMQSSASEQPLLLRYVRDRKLVAEVSMPQLQWNGQSFHNRQFELNAPIDADIDIKQLKVVLQDFDNNFLDDIGFSNADISVQAKLAVQNKQITVTLENPSVLNAEGLLYDGISASELDLNIPEQTVAYRYGGVVTPVNFSAAARQVSNEHISLESLNVSGTLQLDHNDMLWQLRNDPFEVTLAERGSTIGVPQQFYSGRWMSNKQEPTTTFSISNACRTELILGRYENNHLYAKAHQSFSPTKTFARWVNVAALTSDITAGELNVALDWDLQATWPNVAASLNNADISGSLGDFSNVQVSFRGEGGEYLIDGSVASMSIGVDITAFAAQLSMQLDQTPQIAIIKALSAEVFGGNVNIENQRYIPGADSFINVAVNHLDLNKIISTQNLSDLATTGSLSGIQPIKIDDKGRISLENGILNNDGNGVIRYKSNVADAMQVNQQLKLTLDVLKNFEYQTLKTQTSYKDGSLIFQSNISGSNPDVAGGQKVDLNLNTEVPLLPALQAMRIQSGLEAQVEKLVQPKQKQQRVDLCY